MIRIILVNPNTGEIVEKVYDATVIKVGEAFPGMVLFFEGRTLGENEPLQDGQVIVEQAENVMHG